MKCQKNQLRVLGKQGLAKQFPGLAPRRESAEAVAGTAGAVGAADAGGSAGASGEEVAPDAILLTDLRKHAAGLEAKFDEALEQLHNALLHDYAHVVVADETADATASVVRKAPKHVGGRAAAHEWGVSAALVAGPAAGPRENEDLLTWLGRLESVA